MSVLLGPDVVLDVSFTADEQVAVAVLAESGLVPPLRLIRGEGGGLGVLDPLNGSLPPRSTG
ncbi:MAG TPA: hypothetical protein VLR88_03990 [Propionibacteriaceae bacterium]|nr:hypothetical protein [Propionibacteriaceae bacterium]